MKEQQDKLHRFIFDELNIRGELVYLHDCWHKVREHADYPPNVRRQLGEALAAVAILSATIKYDGSLILQVRGDGPISTLVAQAGNTGNLRGLAKWRGEVPARGLGAIYGKGQMALTISNRGGERYQSVVALEGDGLAAALEHYFHTSEQLGSRFWFFVGADSAAGLFLQQLPGGQGDTDAWQRVCTLAETTRAEEIHELEPEALLRRLFHEERVRLFEPRELCFSCGCSRDKIENTLLSMGQDAVQEIVAAEGSVEVDCEFCNRHYSFSSADIERLFSSPPDPDEEVLH